MKRVAGITNNSQPGKYSGMSCVVRGFKKWRTSAEMVYMGVSLRNGGNG